MTELTVHVELLVVEGSKAVREAVPVHAFVLLEELNQPFTLTVTVPADEDHLDTIDAERLFVMRRGDWMREIPCVVDEVRPGMDLGDVQIVLRPRLSRLCRTKRSRIFAARATREVVEALVEGTGIRVTSDIIAEVDRDYRVQYEEDSLTFLRRVLAQDGVAMVLRADGVTEVVHLIDTNGALGEHIDVPVFDGTPPTDVEGMFRFDARGRTDERLRSYERRWEWSTRARGVCDVADGGRPDQPHHATIDASRDPDELDAHLRAQSLRRRGLVYEATGDMAALQAGSVVKVGGGEHAGVHAFVEEIYHHGMHATSFGAVYLHQEVVLLPLTAPAAPPPVPRPLAKLQTAIVVGPRQGEPHTDRWGRICVRMHWDDEEQGDECWLRVMTPWAGDGYGWIFVPRVGMEVVVDFLHGDPDRPICMGCVYGGETEPPDELPDLAPRGVLRSRTLDKGFHHEIAMDDTPGHEEMKLLAYRKMRERVMGSRTAQVDADDYVTVGGDATLHVSGTRTDITGKNHDYRVVGDLDVKVSGAMVQQVSIRGAPASVGAKVSVLHGTYELDAADGIVLRCGESTLAVLPGEVVITSPRVRIQSASSHVQLEEGLIHATGKVVEIHGAQAQLQLDGSAALRCARTQSAVTISGGDVRVFGVGSARVEAPVVQCEATQSMDFRAPTLHAEADALSLAGAGIGLSASGGVDVIATREVVVRGQVIRLN